MARRDLSSVRVAVSGGAPVPAELVRRVEEVLFAHPAVAEVAVVGIPDHTWGEVVAALVRPAPDQPTPATDELRAYCREHLAPYKTPAHWVFLDAFPMTPSGKIQKYKLREHFTEDQPGQPQPD